MSELQKMLDAATKNFREKAKNEIVDRTFNRTCQGVTEEITIEKNKISNNLTNVCLQQIDAEEFVRHFQHLEPYVQFSSSVESFAKLHDMQSTIRDDIPYFDKRQVEELRKSGAVFHTMREKNDMVFDTRQHGVQWGDKKSSARGLLRTVGSKAGRYLDEFSPEGFTKYESPCDQPGMLRFRWIQFLKQEYHIPMFFLLVRWFGLDSPIHDAMPKKSKFHAQKGKLVFMIIPVTVVTSEEQSKYNMFFSRKQGEPPDSENLGKSIERPLPLQMIEPEECFQIMYNLSMMKSTEMQFKNRPSLTLYPNIERYYNYDALTGAELEKKLEKWAKDTGKKCPDGRKCHNKKFDDLAIGKLHIGHIISKDWCDAFKLGERFQNHPYNLYLTCGSCNESLHNHFPDEKLQKKLDEEKATIGDWAIQFDSAIRNTRI